MDNNSDSRPELFKTWEPASFGWIIKNVSWWGYDFTKEEFEQMYNREPGNQETENIENLIKAGIVISNKFGQLPPPTQMTDLECQLVCQSAQILSENIPSIYDRRASVWNRLNSIGNANPQCFKYWKKMMKHTVHLKWWEDY